MNTLLELITLTKGIEYLLAIAFLFAFVGFWLWMQNRGKSVRRQILPLALVSLAFAGLAASCFGTPATATTRPEVWASVDEAHYLANIYGPAKFAAHEMGPDVISCQTCHHHSPNGQIQPCRDCHNDPFDGSTPDKPGLKAAYHQRCMDCHKEAFSGPMSCTECHADKPDTAQVDKKDSPSPATAPLISHPLLDSYANCFACHTTEGPLPLPGNHSSYKANVVCLGCHKPSTTRQALSTLPVVQAKTIPQEEVSTAAPAVEAPSGAAPAAASTGPSQMTHPVAGRENCLMCHGQGIGGAARVPADHVDRSNDGCQMCHKPSSQS